MALSPAVHAEAERAAAARGAQPRGSGGWPLLAQDFEAHLIACPAPCASLQLHDRLFCAAPSVGLRCWLDSHALPPSPCLHPANSPLVARRLPCPSPQEAIDQHGRLCSPRRKSELLAAVRAEYTAVRDKAMHPCAPEDSQSGQDSKKGG